MRNKSVTKKRFMKTKVLALMLCFMLISVNAIMVHVDAEDELMVTEEATEESEEVVEAEANESAAEVQDETESEPESEKKDEPQVEEKVESEPEEKDESQVEEKDESNVEVKDELQSESKEDVQSQEDEQLLEEEPEDMNEEILEDDIVVSNELDPIATEEIGAVTVVLPSDTGSTYEVTWGISQYKADGQPVSLSWQTTYDVEVTSAVGTTTTKTITFTNAWNDAGGYGEWIGTIEGVEAGSEVVIPDMEIIGGTGDNAYVQTNCLVSVKSSDALEKLTFTGQENPLIMTEGGNHTLTVSSELGEMEQILTDATFKSLGGKYTLEYLLSGYNVISFDDIEAIHIVGAVISKNDTTKHTVNPLVDTLGGVLSIADYTRGYLSYIGSLQSAEGNLNESAVKMEYDYDNTMANKYGWAFTKPNLYIGETDSNGDMMGLQKESGVDHVLLMDGSDFVSPNAQGTVPTYQNDEFINFNSLQQAIINESVQLYNDGSIDGEMNIIVVEAGDIPSNGILNVEAGTSVRIMDASNLTGVNLVFEDGFDYYKDPFSEPTTVSFAGSTINPIDIKGVSHSRFPVTYINGKEVDAVQGEDGEYGELGSKIIWNLPNVVTSESGVNRMVTYGTGQNIVGHIVAPRAEYWNYENSGNTWEGGNINGCTIVANFKAGMTETHMFPYFGKKEPPKEDNEESIEIDLKAIKTFTGGDLASQTFDFVLEYIGSEAIGDYDSSWTPKTATSDADGNVEFESLEFEEAGTYLFQVSEKLPEDHETSEIDYDETIYHVTIEVTDGAEADDMTATIKIEQIKDRDGADITANVVEQITFENKAIIEPTIAYMDVILKKADALNRNIVLEGAKFTVEQIVSDTDHTVVLDGYSESYTSGKDGTFTITELQESSFYKLTEKSAPTGYYLSTDYWVIAIDKGATSYTVTKYTIEGEKLVDVTDSIITNIKKETFTLPETGGVGTTNMIYIVGGAFLLGATLLLKRRKRA